MGHQTHSSKQSLAIVVPELLPVPPVKGGAVEHWVHEVVHRLDSNRFNVTVFSRPSGQMLGNGVHYVGIPWTRLEQAFYWMKERVTWRNPLRYVAKIQNVVSYGRRVAAQLAPFDTVIIHNEPNLLLFITPQASQQLVLHMHNDHLTHRAFRWMYRKALHKADLVICVSQYIKSNAVQYFPEHAHKFVVLFNATDPTVFKPYGALAREALQASVPLSSEHQYLLYVGRLTPEKGVDVLIKAFALALQHMPTLRLIITGSSFFEGAAKTSYQQALIALAKPISHAIVFTGFVPHEKLKYLYSSVDLIVLPSVWQDPCPLVVLETMASGTCLVASKVGGVPEVVEDNLNGFLVEPNQPAQLATTIINVLNHPMDKHRVELLARKTIESGYTWVHLVSNMCQLLTTNLTNNR